MEIKEIKEILFFEKGVLFLPASWAVPIRLPAGRRNETPFWIIISACYTNKPSLYGNLLI